MGLAEHGEHALAGGWAARAAELVDDICADCVEHGWLAFVLMFRALGEGDLVEAERMVLEAYDAGRRFHDADLTAMGTCARGRLSIMPGASPRDWRSSTTPWSGSWPASCPP